MEKGKTRQTNREVANRQKEGEFPLNEEQALELFPTQHNLETLRQKKNLLEEILNEGTIRSALKKVVSNKGAAGIDGMTITELSSRFVEQWPLQRTKILEGHYRAQPVKEVLIPKPDGEGMRPLGIPTVMDRLIQQAVMIVLQKYIDNSFSKNSYGYRPGKSASEAVLQAKEYIDRGYETVVEIDVEKFFNNVNQDRLMSQLKEMILDQRVLDLIRQFLNSGVMRGLESKRMEKGVPQGSPLSPLLSNIYLHVLDEELSHRDLRFVRYADDCSIFVKSQRSGERVLTSITRFIEKKLKLLVNPTKSKISKKSNILGFEICNQGIKIARKNIIKLKERVRMLTPIRGGSSIPVMIGKLNQLLRGWREYFKIKTVKSPDKGLDSWIRRRLRACIYRGMKNGDRRYQIFLSAKINPDTAYRCAYAGYGVWSMSLCKAMRIVYSNKRLEKMGLCFLAT